MMVSCSYFCVWSFVSIFFSVNYCFFFFFFFSSRRRHTRYWRDWSSDVCSSDLMNLNLYGHAGKWLMIDLGIGFADDSMPGVDVIMPDPAFIEERRADLVGIVLTHAHEDHLGAVADLWPRLKAPVYATPFAASVLRRT